MSGFGYTGGRSRCHAFWTEFMKCYAGAEEPQECAFQKEDYMECLHRRKEIARAKEIKSHFLQKQARESTDARKTAEIASQGVIVSLGLMKPAEEGEGTGNGGSADKKK